MRPISQDFPLKLFLTFRYTYWKSVGDITPFPSLHISCYPHSFRRTLSLFPFSFLPPIMFTPPPSPLPHKIVAPAVPEESSEVQPEKRIEGTSREAIKRRTGRRFRLAVMVVPLIVIALTLSTSYSTSFAFQESSHLSSPLSWLAEGAGLRVHKRSPEPQADSASSTSSTGTPTASSSTPATSRASAVTQTAPAVPSTSPTLPTPFPQPFDDNLAQNFSSASCASFFANMTTSTPFRSCRPFSLLFQSSNEFISAQTNLTLMNALVWGTCNTNTAFDQCKLNMKWFASDLQTACAVELNLQNAVTVNTLTGLNAFSLMHDVGCEIDPTNNAYCYLNAVRNQNPTDSYYYNLPLGVKLPRTAQPTCSSCSRTIMGKYAAALEDSAQRSALTGLLATYEASAEVSVQQCGADFAKTGIVSGSAALRSETARTLTIGFAVVAWLLS
ncbi:unnamed protein product [Cyclocybe aegerita]|uniref:DUF7729 domain-containing protein n=1 Tax=Cyclocybe aegerita TaxID=1973307 RepID=A0A8S0WSA0_CYCAE|nr:unnamed protein product [Cyclocybe aegerita]